MTHGVMVALLILVQSVKVRILMGQQKLLVLNFSPPIKSGAFYFFVSALLNFPVQTTNYEIDSLLYSSAFNRKSLFPGLLQLLLPAK